MAELANLEKYYRVCGFVGCVGAVDCSKIIWKNCLLSQKGQYYNTKDGSLSTNQVEAWRDYDLYVWHLFPGRAGTNNDMKMLSFSPLFNDLLLGNFKFRLASEFRLLGSVSIRDLLHF